MLLYGIESWVVTGAMIRLLEGFNHWISMVNSFRYLGWIILAVDNDWLSVVKNLS